MFVSVLRRVASTLVAVGLAGASMATATATATAATVDPGTGTTANPVIVASAPAGKRAYFADVVRLHDGRLLVAYRESVAHINQDGRIMVAESSDDGHTWSEPRVAVDTVIDDRDPKLMQMRDGTIVMNFFRTNWTGYPQGPATLLGTYVARSSDGGISWGDPAKVGPKRDGPSSVGVGAYSAGYAATHGPAGDLADGARPSRRHGSTAPSRKGPAVVRPCFVDVSPASVTTASSRFAFNRSAGTSVFRKS